MRLLLCAILAFTFVACSSAPVRRPPKSAPANVIEDYKAARAAWDNRDSKRALARLNKILQAHADSDLADDAAILKGDIYFEQQQYQEAFDAYNLVAKGEIASPLEMQASLRAARCLVRLQRGGEAISLLDKIARSRGSNPDDVIAAQEIRYELLTQQKRYLDSLDALLYLGEKHPAPAKRDRYRRIALETLDERLAEGDIRQIADSASYGFLQAPAKYRYALILAEQKEYSRARQYLDDVISLVPDSGLAERAQVVRQQIDARQKVDPRTIGVVLPLSGKQAAIGYRALRGIQHGLGIYGKQTSNFRLAVIDSEGNPDLARRAVERLVVEDNVIAIIGGLLSKTAAAEASRANDLGVPIITMSQKTGITQIGDFVFRNAMTSQMQIQHLVDIAMGQMGLRKFAIIFPNDSYGVEFSNLFWDEVKARGGSIRGAQPYEPDETDFRGHVQRLVGTFYLEDRDDYAKRFEAWKAKNQNRSVREGSVTPEEILPPIIDFEAIFIPDSAKAIGQIVPMLAYNDVTKVHLLGTNIWNSKNLVERANKFVENAVFVDSFLANDRAFTSSSFFTSFKQTFNEEPGVFEVMGHDSGLILRQLIGGGESHRIGLTQRLAQLRDMPGALGMLSVTPEREVKRPVVGLTVKAGEIAPLAQARPQ